MAKLPVNFKETANQRFLEAKRFWQNWQSEAKREFAFVSGDQWLADDVTILNEQKRPPITFNYSEKMIDAVVGAEISNRQEVTYLPRDITDAPLAELWTNAAKWVRDETDAEDEETDAFRDCLICGMGWTHTKMDYSVELDGMVAIGRVDPLEMLSDPSSTKPGLIDRRYNFHVWWIDENLVKRQWPSAIAFQEDETAKGTDTIQTGNRYNDEDESDSADRHRGQVQVRHYECVEQEPVYRVLSEDSIMELSPEEFAALKDSLDANNTQYVKQFRRVYYYAYFAGETFLEGGRSPCQDGFTYQAITGKRDRNKGTWYGLTRVMKDPQRWANKWLSQILHIINSNAKGGILAEINAFVDPQRAQDEWAMPESITLLKEGGINKIEQKQMPPFPAGLDRLMEFALASLPQVTGINLEALGLAGREQANVLEQSRKQAAYGLLAPVFDSLRRYRKQQGRVLLYFIHNYISDNRMIRIGGPESQQFIPLTKADKAPVYDIIVDQSPNAPDVKSKTWEVLVAILPAMMKAGYPVPPSILDYTPLPTALSIQWKEYAAQNQVSPEQVKQMQQQMQKMQEETGKLKLALQDKTAEFQLKRAEAVESLKLEALKITNEIRLAREKQQAELALKHEQIASDRDMKQQEVTAGIEANMHDIVMQGANEASDNILTAVNKLIETIAKLEAEEKADSTKE